MTRRGPVTRVIPSAARDLFRSPKDKDDLALLDAAIAMVKDQLAQGVAVAESREKLEQELEALVAMRNQKAKAGKPA